MELPWSSVYTIKPNSLNLFLSLFLGLLLNQLLLDNFGWFSILPTMSLYNLSAKLEHK
jgi:hypothetical protein